MCLITTAFQHLSRQCCQSMKRCLCEYEDDSILFYATLVDIGQPSDATMIFSAGATLVTSHTLLKVLSPFYSISLTNRSSSYDCSFVDLSLRNWFTAIFLREFQYIQQWLGKIPKAILIHIFNEALKNWEYNSLARKYIFSLMEQCKQ